MVLAIAGGIVFLVSFFYLLKERENPRDKPPGWTSGGMCLGGILMFIDVAKVMVTL